MEDEKDETPNGAQHQVRDGLQRGGLTTRSPEKAGSCPTMSKGQTSASGESDSASAKSIVVAIAVAALCGDSMCGDML